MRCGLSNRNQKMNRISVLSKYIRGDRTLRLSRAFATPVSVVIYPPLHGGSLPKFGLKKKLYGKLSILCLFLLFSCNEVAQLTPALNFDLAEDSEAIYTVSETSYAIDDEPIASTYFIREAVVEIEQKPNEKTYTIERYRRPNETSPWRIERVYKLLQTPAELIEIGESPLVKLTLPISENAAFDVNRYNSLGELTAFYLNVNQPFADYPTTYSVYQANDSTLINLRKIYDVYAPAEGLVYKEITDINYCQTSPDCIGTGEISFGKQVIWRKVR